MTREKNAAVTQVLHLNKVNLYSLAPSNSRKPVRAADVRSKQDVGPFSFIIGLSTLRCQTTDSMMTTSFSRVIKLLVSACCIKRAEKIKAQENKRKLIDHLELA